MQLSNVAMDVQPRVQLITVTAPDCALPKRLTCLVTCIGLTLCNVFPVRAELKLKLVVWVTVMVVVVPVQPKLLLNARSNLLTEALLTMTEKWSRLLPVGAVTMLVAELLLSVNAAMGMSVRCVLRWTRLVCV